MLTLLELGLSPIAKHQNAFTTGMQWLLWTATLVRNQTSSSLRNGPSYMGSPQPMPSVLQVNMPVARVPYIPPKLKCLLKKEHSFHASSHL